MIKTIDNSKFVINPCNRIVMSCDNWANLSGIVTNSVEDCQLFPSIQSESDNSPHWIHNARDVMICNGWQIHRFSVSYLWQMVNLSGIVGNCDNFLQKIVTIPWNCHNWANICQRIIIISDKYCQNPDNFVRIYHNFVTKFIAIFDEFVQLS